GIMACVVIAMGSLLVMFALPTESNYATSQATAQYLEQNTIVSPAFIRVNQDCRDGAEHCFWIVPEIIADADDLYGDMYRQSETLVIMIDGDITQALSPVLFGANLYVDLELNRFGAGLHLIEVQISDEDGRIYRHMWAERSETGVIEAPATLAVPPTYATAIPDEND
ncbi:MAG: hypothetical protein AAFV93_20045, partial [Chloroflexota bacterium]